SPCAARRATQAMKGTNLANETLPRRRSQLAIAEPADLSRDELRRLAKAERKLTSPDPAQSDVGRRAIKMIERQRIEPLESLSLAERLAETMVLAGARGEEVRSEAVRTSAPVIDEHGARVVQRGLPAYRQETVTRVRVLSRGGLQLAFERGDLDGGP